jgi:predicted metal-dependent HD superfamily phosphohydrolase
MEPAPDLLERYGEPHRRYHNLDHIHACLQMLAGVAGISDADRHVIGLALWWHDAIYDPARADNEARSADLAASALKAAGEPETVRREVDRLIRLTAGHAVDEGDRLGALLVSIDLSILGAAPEAYDRYAAAIREEYDFVPEPLYRAGRQAVLKRFLDADPIFPEPTFAARFEAPARANLARKLATLGG